MPWGRLDDSLYDHPKLDDLPSDPEACEAILETLEPDQIVKLAALGLWARSISWSNRHLTDGQAPRAQIRKLDGSSALADALVAAGFYETGAAGYVVHDFLQFNPSRADVLAKRADDAKRQAEWRANKKKRTDDKNGTGKRHSVSHDVTPRTNEPDVTPPVTALVTAPHARDSRSANPDPTRPDPMNLSPDGEIPRGRTRRAERADIAALHGRGWKRVTKAQRAVLDEVNARHDVTGPEFAAEVIRATPADKDPLAAVMSADRLWQDARRRRADAEEAAWQATKAADRDEAGGISWLREPAGAES